MTTIETLRKIVVAQVGCDPAKVVPEAIWEDLQVDSLDAIEIEMAIEERLSLPDADGVILSARTVGQTLENIGLAIAAHRHPATTIDE